uniref:Signal recognition particle 19 kDa protein n=1 Tax=Oryza meridionalis TaxID=40149 RepID=A0A0E0E1J8_9ORYZ
MDQINPIFNPCFPVIAIESESLRLVNFLLGSKLGSPSPDLICAALDRNRAEMDGGDLRSSIKKWNVIYPVYLNSKKTVAEGRRIASGKACPDPTCVEIADCCSHLKIPHAIELDKAYPRDFFQVGRVRVQLKKDDGSPVNPAIKTKKQLMIQIAELVPKHHGRTKKQEPAASSTAGTSKGKGGKKKK